VSFISRLKPIVKKMGREMYPIKDSRDTRTCINPLMGVISPYPTVVIVIALK
jgi:hypothetical protein